MDAQVSCPPPVEEVVAAFLKPRPPQRRRDLVLEGGETLCLTTPEGEVSLQRAGNGPAVLLVHGWEGQASDLAAFVPALLQAGFEVIAVDLPAHGRSAGHETAIPQLARALMVVGQSFGPMQAVIAHSMGAAVLAEALRDGLQAERVVMIAAPAHYAMHARAFAVASGLDETGAQRMVELLSAAINADVTEISMPLIAPHLRQRALFIHSADDQVATIAESLESAAAWPGARHERVEGLGHRRILKDPSVITMAMAFVTDTISPSAAHSF